MDNIKRRDAVQMVKRGVVKEKEDYDVEDIPHPKKRAFLRALVSTGGNIKRASQLVGIGPITHYNWIKDPAYKMAFEKQYIRSTETLEAEAIRRGFEGLEEEIYHNGKVVGTKSKYSDNLLMFIMKSRDDKYKDISHQKIGVFGQGDMQVMFNIPRPGVTGINSLVSDIEPDENDIEPGDIIDVDVD